ncbi:FAD-binding protein [Amycolatopsis sp. NPDC004747]
MTDTRSGSEAASAPVFGPVTVSAGDPRYPSVVEGYNHRFTGSPDYVRFVGSTAQVVEAVTEAVAAGKRLAVRSGGHCFEDFTSSSAVKALIDLSPMNAVYFDERMGAFAVEGGATLLQVYRALFHGWGVTIPAGTCFEVGVGGHIPGGGYGHLSRRDGLVVDHLHAVEVVVVDESGQARAVVATRAEDDPNRDLWWAHTGGGGGNFGVVTRFWLRTPGAEGTDPAGLLPKAPSMMRRKTVMWSWDGMTEADFKALIRNYCVWFERNDDAESPYANLWSNFIAVHKSAPMFGMTAVLDEAVPDAAALLQGQLDAITEGVTVEPAMHVEDVIPWMSSWLPSYSWPNDPNGRYKHKAGYLRRRYSERQLDAIYRHLSSDGYVNPQACLVLTAYGAKANTVGKDDTAIAQRDAILKASYSAGMWQAEAEDDKHIAWVREYYRDVYADTGGVPVPNEVNDGSYISYPDTDLADPVWNTSGVPWPTLYYKHHYPKLQEIKGRYDPLDVFRHALSIERPEAG